MEYLLVGVLLFANTVTCLQRFVVEPSDKSVIAGSTAILDCMVENKEGPLQWTKDSFGLGTSRDLTGFERYSMIGSEADGEYKLMIQDTRLEDDGTYQCQVAPTANARGIRSRNARLSILILPDRPKIDEGSVMQVTAGRQYNITCTAINGKPAPTITWVSRGEIIRKNWKYWSIVQSDGKREDATSVLTITPTKSDQGRTYECQVKNSAMFAPHKTDVTLEVRYAPELRMSVQPSQNLKEFQTITFTCDGKGNPNKLAWKWYKNDQLIPGEESNYLEFTHISRDYHNSIITCECTNEIGSTKQSYTLDIRYGPKFTVIPKHLSVDVGDAAVLNCDASGNPAPVVYWRKRSQPGKVVLTGKTLTVPEVTEKDFGRYTCVASVQGFREIEKDVYILKKGPPKISSSSRQYATSGQIATVKCETISVPEPQNIVWRRLDNQINPNTDVKYSVKEEDFFTGRRSILKIQNLSPSDYGEYNCTVENGYGQDSRVIQLLQKDTIPLAYVLIGVFGGVGVILLLAVILFLCNRNRSDSGGESNSANNTLEKKKKAAQKEHEKQQQQQQQQQTGNGDIKVEYDPENNRYSTTLEPWQKNTDHGYYGYRQEYDEVNLNHTNNKDINIKSATNGGFNIHKDPYPPDIKLDYPDTAIGTYRRDNSQRVPNRNSRYDCGPGYSTYNGNRQYAQSIALSESTNSERELPTMSRLSTNV
ncbi:irregular chiasm C-roughest protein-like isoform X2 [Tubulanus polymorphus]|uniref:irregular chiasm C-roughest protein-like isoform X2 n=1 Tax=Tubulanus polymorphus TaxID=672921 RepID=UPI003DA4F5DF